MPLDSTPKEISNLRWSTKLCPMGMSGPPYYTTCKRLEDHPYLDHQSKILNYVVDWKNSWLADSMMITTVQGIQKYIGDN